MTREDRLESALREFIACVGKCTCHEGYTSRKLEDPACHYHNYKSEIDAALLALETDKP